MYGKVIGTSIAVNCFQEVTKNGIYFLTERRLKSPIPDHVDRVYTSPHNAWLLRIQHQADEEKIIGLPINEHLHIQDKVKKLDFHVTLLDAKQKPGSVMFLFEGEEIGNVLYAGKCCYSDNLFSRPFCNILKSKVLDYLYVHEACPDCDNHSMTVSSAIQDIINIVKWNRNCKIVINEPCFREDILRDLKERLMEPISVSENIMKHLEDVGFGSDFTLEQSGTQVFITEKPYDHIVSNGDPVFKIILTPCTMKRTSDQIQEKLYKLEKKGFNVMLYRNHSSLPELTSLVRDVNAKHTVLIRRPTDATSLSEKKEDLCFWSHLGNFQRIVKFLDGLQNELEKPEVSEFAISESSVRTSVKGFEDSKLKDDNRLEMEKSSSKVQPEADPLEPTILIESDVESIGSEDTVKNIKLS